VYDNYDDFMNDPNPDWFCKSCGQLFDEDELDEDGLCPDCAESESEYNDEDDDDDDDGGWS